MWGVRETKQRPEGRMAPREKLGLPDFVGGTVKALGIEEGFEEKPEDNHFSLRKGRNLEEDRVFYLCAEF